MYCRKDFLDLTPLERNRLAEALNELYDQGGYDKYPTSHEDGWFSIHHGPEFLPWHRWYLLKLELELRSIDARVSLPYWDWTRSGAKDLDAEPWKSFFGGRDNNGGRFDHWSYTRAGGSGGNTLPDYGDVIDELDVGTYAAYRAEEDGSHVPAHTWTGGTMDRRASPGDPLFFLHHCNIDRLWAIWQVNNAGAAQYTQDPSTADRDAFTGSKDGPNDPMFAGSLGGAATPAAMLDHRALGYRYPVDPRLAAEWAAAKPGTLVTGDPTDIGLATPAVTFNDVPEGETTMRAIRFSVDGCRRLLFEVTAGPTGPFTLDDSGPFAFPPGPFSTDDLRIWLEFTGQAPSTNASGLISVRAVDAVGGDEVDRWDDIPISANSVARPTAAVALILDESGSMLYDAGNNRDSRLEVLQLAATTFIDQLFDDNGLMLVAFDETATRLSDLAVAGGQTSGVRNAARNDILNHGPPNNQPHTSIGAGIQEAAAGYDASPLTPDFDVKAMIVFTDGIEDRAPWLDEVESLINDRIYAIGVANAANVDNNKLRTIANNSGGFMLVTGAVTEDDDFLLEKFFLQVLAGVTNRDIIVDPPGQVVPGAMETVPFSLTRSDVEFDAVVLTRAPQLIVTALRTPDGTIVGPAELPAGGDRSGATSRTLRVTLPLVVNGVGHWEGDWELLLGLRYKIHDRRLAAATSFTQSGTVPYHAVVHARSSLNLRAGIAQSGLLPGAELFLQAHLTEYGQPLPTHPSVRAELKPPTGPIVTIEMTEDTIGSFRAELIATEEGVYRFRVIAEGQSRRFRRFTREHLLTATIGHPTRPPGGRPPGDTRPDPALCELLVCLLSPKVLTERFEKRLEELGLNVDQLRRCLKVWCRQGRKGESSVAAIATLLERPHMIAALRKLLDDETAC